MYSIQSEQLITLKQARGEFANRPSLPTIWRWILRGSKGIRLESIRIGGRRYTSKEAIGRFMEATVKADRLATSQQKSKKDKQEQALIRAKLALDQFGV